MESRPIIQARGRENGKQIMLVSYGQGTFIQDTVQYKGRIVLSEHKLFLSSPEGDLAATYIPLEKIVRIRKMSSGIEVFVRPSLLANYTVVLQGDQGMLLELLREIVVRRGLKRKLLFNDWVDPSPLL